VDLTVLFAEPRSKGKSDDTLRDRLQEEADHDLGDFLSFRIGEAKKEITNAPGGGA